MISGTTNLKLKLNIYKREIRWLLKEKYQITDLLKQEHLYKLLLSRQKDIDSNKLIIQYTDFIAITEDIKRILNGEPIDHVIGFKDFLNCRIDLSLKPLIPRAETEFWVQNAIKNIRNISNNSKFNILDLCCGSGCIGIAFLKNIPKSKLTFVDISNLAIKQTILNLQVNNFKFINKYTGSNFKIAKSDLYSNLQDQKFDFIFTNPPYVKDKDIKGSLKYEPKIALEGGGESGLEIIYKILDGFSKYLNPGGKIYIEFGYGQKLKIEEKLKQLGHKNYLFYKDQFGKYRNLEILFN